jgi:hypothetical protein
MRLGSIAVKLVAFFGKTSEVANRQSTQLLPFYSAAADNRLPFLSQFSQHLNFSAMASVEVPYPNLPETFNEDLKDEDGALMSKR